MRMNKSKLKKIREENRLADEEEERLEKIRLKEFVKIPLKENLTEWVANKEKNGIKQHGKKWLQAKVFTIGGSSLATIMGKNPYSNIPKMVGEKIGLFKFVSDIKPQWGNLFEDVIKRYVELDRDCEILGEDLYIDGPPGTSYSPDGLAVMDVVEEYMFEEEIIVESEEGPCRQMQMVIKSVPKTTIVLIEFKCPYSRIPSGSPPEYYVPQVKMGLDLLDLPTVGLFIEGVFRRCTWDDLGNNPVYDKTLVPKSSGKLPLAYGIIGFYFDADKFYSKIKKFRTGGNERAASELESTQNMLFNAYKDFYVEMGDCNNEYMCNDLGESPPELFKMIMNAYDKKIIVPWYGCIKYVDANAVTNNGKASAEDIVKKMEKLNISTLTYTENAGAESMNEDLATFTEYCAANGHLNLGILPWKLFRVDYNFIQKTPDYVKPWLPKIREIIDVVKECTNPANAAIKSNIYNAYLNKNSQGRFSDDF